MQGFPITFITTAMLWGLWGGRNPILRRRPLRALSITRKECQCRWGSWWAACGSLSFYSCIVWMQAWGGRWLVVNFFFSNLFKREGSCGLRHGGDLTTHTPSWLPSPCSTSLMKFASIPCRAVFLVLEATLMRLMKSCYGKFWYNDTLKGWTNFV